MTPALWFGPVQVDIAGAAIGLPIAAAIPVADGPGRHLLVGLGLGRLDGVQPAADGDFPTFIAPLFNQFSHWKTKPSNNACRI